MESDMLTTSKSLVLSIGPISASMRLYQTVSYCSLSDSSRENLREKCHLFEIIYLKGKLT